MLLKYVTEYYDIEGKEWNGRDVVMNSTIRNSDLR